MQVPVGGVVIEFLLARILHDAPGFSRLPAAIGEVWRPWRLRLSCLCGCCLLCARRLALDLLDQSKKDGGAREVW